MVKGSSVIITLLILVLLQQVVIDNSSAAEFTSNSRNNCSDSSSLIADCNEEEEMLMDSEVSRRFLAASGKKITYDAVARDTDAPCRGSGGNPYGGGKCYDPKKANDDNVRPCLKIYHCRS
ncbi:hypothetical protein MKX01_007658 [Papaver californicum]|nr:hypothetical protein MKX01_020769 [Papaver californicum]KAI3997771.1 hypothetical protein MKX01_007658 [Papaver californicum]